LAAGESTRVTRFDAPGARLGNGFVEATLNHGTAGHIHGERAGGQAAVVLHIELHNRLRSPQHGGAELRWSRHEARHQRLNRDVDGQVEHRALRTDQMKL